MLPMLFPHIMEPGYTHVSKNCLVSPGKYVMARILRPIKIVGRYMTTQAAHTPFKYFDSQT